MKKLASIGFALLMIFAVFVPFVSANDGAKETKGYLYVDLACRSPQISGEFTATPVIVSAPFTNAARVDKGFVDVYVKKVGEPQTFKFLPQGQFDTQAEPGTYLLQMEDANGGQPEYALVTIKAGFKETVVFLGHGISGITEKAKDIITVTEASYGEFKTEVDVPAHDVPHAATPATGIKLYNCDKVVVGYFMGFPVYDYPAGHVHAKEVSGTPVAPNRFTYDGDTYQITGSKYDDAFMVTPGTPAYTEHVPATYKVVGYFADVKAEVQQALDNGAQTMKFRNDLHPGGIFTPENQLLVQVADPLEGTVKDVHIVYTVNGGAPQTVDTKEYQVFTLA